MLTVYKASAGSGKTFRLAVEYIKHLIISPRRYENILAVTFTNKATEEMKMRILSQLYGIAHHLDDSQSYLDVIRPELQEMNRENKFTESVIDDEFISNRAATALNLLLHHYNYFRVETIDRFFQTVLRNLARELDLSPSLRVEIADKEVVHQAVDRWIERLTDNNRELNWILDYVRSSMDDDKSWNIIQKIKDFGEVLLTDEYKEVSPALNDKLQSADQKFYEEYIRLLRSIITQAEAASRELGKEMWSIMESHGLDESSFVQGSRGVGKFIKNMSENSIMTLKPNSYVLKAIDPDDTNADNWVKKGTSAAVRDVCRELLRPALISAMDKITVQQIKAKSASVTLKNMSRLRMLFAIQNEIESYNRDNDSFLLSDTQELLHSMIADSDSPFIFEKIGAHLQNIMIDEFQDTSRIQWRNFKVLLNDCMSHGHENLIVGDVKQSIYRWRSGDWRLLNNIENEFPGQTRTTPLDTNRRSATRVIDFNNAFFKRAIETIHADISKTCKTEDADMLLTAYEDVHQNYPEDSTPSGYVEMRLLPKEDSMQATLDFITETIISLIEKGLQQRDIAILVRKNKYIPVIAQHCIAQFKKHENKSIRDISIVSDEAYLLSASPAIGIIIDSLRHLSNPADNIVRARLSVAYQRYVLHDERPQSQLLNDAILPPRWNADLVTLPLYQLCEEIFDIFSLSSLEGQSSYICCFFDGLCEFMQRSVPDIQSFLKFWDESLNKKKIECNTNNGIRILSIHKSKGLEFQSVIVPFCDWELEHSGGSLLWCEPDQEPFNELPVLPLNYRELTGTIYEDDYWEEHLQNEVDNINLLYVALTRAKDNMFITTTKEQNNKYRGMVMQTIMPQLKDDLEGAEFSDDILTFGDIVIPKKKSTKKTSNVFLQPSEPHVIVPSTNSTAPEFRESNASKDFTLTDEQEEEQQRSQYIQLGNVLHRLFSYMQTADDLDSSLLRLEMEGLLYGQDITSAELHKHIEQCLNNPQVASWFSSRWRIYNECNILTFDEEEQAYVEHRPDRVMTDGKETIVVDFKLYSLKEDYSKQVRRYMEQLRNMGYPNVRGYLWQVFSNKITEV